MTAPFHRLLAALLLLPAAVAPLQAREDKPNIVLIFADDLGWHDVGFTNPKGFFETPNIDSLAKDGMTFTAAYAGAANCAPSRACLLSGKYTPRHGVYAVGSTSRGPQKLYRLDPVPNREYLQPEIVTMAETLKGLGYATGHFGKWHLGQDSKGTGPRQQGFDVSDPALIQPPDGEPDPADPKRAFSITKEACDFIAENKERPFFAYVAHHAVHARLEARPETLAKFQAKAKTVEPDAKPLYAASTYDLDATVGILLKQLSDLGLERDTLVIFTSDNGGTPQSPNEPLRGATGAYYEAGIREPFVARWPGHIKPGSSCAVPVINQDFYPTFATLAGGKPAEDLDGTTLTPLLDGGSALPRDAIFWHFPGYLDVPVPRGRDTVFRTRPVTAMRQGDWKLLCYHEEWLLDGGKDKLDTNNAVELYNLKDDPGEHHNLAATNKKERDELVDRMEAWWQKVKAPLPTVPSKAK